MQFFLKWAEYAKRFVGRAWYLPAIAGLAGLDLFILMVPSDALLISAVLVHPIRKCMPRGK